MNLLHIGNKEQESPALITKEGCLYDLSQIISDFSPDTINPNSLVKLNNLDINTLPQLEDKAFRIGPCIKRPPDIIAVGLNYRDHAKETKMDIPTEPVIFFKACSSISGPNDNVIIPRHSTKVDWEVELGVIILKDCHNVNENEAMDYVAGYCIVNDVSARDLQMLPPAKQWVLGKSCDTFCPIGPYFVTKDKIADPHTLNLWLKVNGKTMQSSNTSQLIFDIPTLIAYISQRMRIKAGSLILTGTPSGVALGQRVPCFLKPGDTMELGIDGLGTQQQKVISFEQSLNNQDNKD